MESRDRHDPFLPNLAMTPRESVIAKLGNQGLKQSKILKLTFEKSHVLSSEIKSGDIFFCGLWDGSAKKSLKGASGNPFFFATLVIRILFSSVGATAATSRG